MAKRAADTYRSARREAWKAIPSADRPTWAEHNRAALTPAFGIGSARKPGIMSPFNRSWHPRYWLTKGAKERARHAGKPDGAMHAVPPIHLRNAQAIAASKAVAS